VFHILVLLDNSFLVNTSNVYFIGIVVMVSFADKRTRPTAKHTSYPLYLCPKNRIDDLYSNIDQNRQCIKKLG